MNANSYSRIFENVLFTVLVATVIGCVAASVAADSRVISTSSAVVVATAGVGNS